MTRSASSGYNVSRHRVLIVGTHVTQYAAAMFRELAQIPLLDIHVAYCSLMGARVGMDRDFGTEVKWDIPLLGGYSWEEIPNRSWRPGLGRFWGLFNPQLWNMVRQGNYDAVVLYTGYRYATFWVTFFAAKLSHVPVLYNTDAAALDSRDGSRWKPRVKRWFWPYLFGWADQALAPSTGTQTLLRSLGIPMDQITLVPYVVDNGWWHGQAAAVDRDEVRAAWGVPDEAKVVLFCAKLQSWKGPMDLLQAVAKVDMEDLFLVFAGDGPLRQEIEKEAVTLGVAERVRMLGFVNQSGLPAAYVASDLLVLPSRYEPFGVVLNEAMLCGRPVIVSDRVGARHDLVREGETGYTFPCGDIDALAQRIAQIFSDRQNLKRMGEAARRRLETWSPREYGAAWVTAIQRAQRKAANT